MLFLIALARSTSCDLAFRFALDDAVAGDDRALLCDAEELVAGEGLYAGFGAAFVAVVGDGAGLETTRWTLRGCGAFVWTFDPPMLLKKDILCVVNQGRLSRSRSSLVGVWPGKGVVLFILQ